MRSPSTVGARLRSARQKKGKSLKEIADQAEISPATLSRIETSKQALDFSLFVVLARILETNPAELIGAPGNDFDQLLDSFLELDHQERLRFWSAMSKGARLRANLAKSRTAEIRRIAAEVEELLACIDYVQSELVAIQKRLQK